MAEHPQFTDEEIDELKVMLREFEHYRWLGRLTWRVGIILGGIIASLAAFKDQIASLFKGN